MLINSEEVTQNVVTAVDLDRELVVVEEGGKGAAAFLFSGEGTAAYLCHLVQ